MQHIIAPLASSHERMLRACALRSGQILNKSDLARDVGISASTANAWISVLAASGQVVLLDHQSQFWIEVKATGAGGDFRRPNPRQRAPLPGCAPPPDVLKFRGVGGSCLL